VSGKARRLYRFYNISQEKHGEPFCMCDFHYGQYKPPVTCIMEKIADRCLWPCTACEDDDEQMEQERFERAAAEPHVTQKEPIWCVVLKNTRAALDGVRLQSDAWSYRHDLSDIDLPDHEIIAKTRPVREC